MVISGLQIFLHMALNYVLIFGLKMGLVGAAAALTASAWAAAAGYVLYVGNTPIGPQWRIRPPRLDWATRILRVAAPAAGMAVMRVFSLIVFMLALKLLPNGSAAIGGASVAFGIESIMFMPSFGLSNAAGALVGQSLGAQNPDRAERLGWTAAHHAALVTLALVVPIYMAAPWIANFLVAGKPAIAHEATLLLRYLCVTEVFFAYAMVTMGSMQGAGETVRPFWITVVSLWGLRVPLAFVLALPSGQSLFGSLVLPFGLGLGSSGAWLSMAITQGIQGVLSVMAFKQGQWKLKTV